ncbi:MAG: sel1 repeat family protein [Rhodobacterales bacterium]
MRKMLLALLAVVAIALTFAYGADFQKGMDAYNNGDYTTALKKWQPLAKQGGAQAQYNLGLMYGNGQGVPQDYIMAYMWFNLAGANGIKDAVKNKEMVSKILTRTDLSKAQALSSRCLACSYKNCGT